MIAVITASKFNFEQYLIESGLTVKKAKQVSTFKDLDQVFTSYVKLIDSDNVPEAVVRRMKIASKK